MVLPTTTSRRLHLVSSALLCAQNTHVALGLATSHFRDHTHHHRAQTLDSQGFTYDYSRHGSDWVQGMCSSTERQSPVSLTTAGLASTGKLVYSYVPLETGFSMQNNGHTITADFMGLGVGGLSYNNGWYNLMSVNFHSPSEHVYDGVHHPLEAHLVHKRSDSDHLVIVAVPFAAGGSGAGSSAGSNSGSSSQTATAAFLQQKKSSGSQESSEKSAPSPLGSFALGIPESVGQTLFAAPPVDFMGFYGEKDFVEYGGSLTAPPCAETATWFVRKEAVDGGDAEVGKFQNAILAITNGMGNNRNTMPMNGRPVAITEKDPIWTRLSRTSPSVRWIGVRTAVPELPAAARGPASMGSGLATMSSAEKTANREYQALMWAKEAMDEAKAAKQYAQTLDEKLRAQGPPDVGTPAGSAPVAATPGGLASTAAATVTQIATPL
eukprot:g3640.t1